MATKLKVWDSRMLQLMGMKTSGAGSITQKEFLNKVGFNHANISQILSGKQSFRHEHFYKACKVYGISMDWFYGFSEEMKLKSKNATPVDLLKQAIVLIQGTNKK